MEANIAGEREIVEKCQKLLGRINSIIDGKDKTAAVSDHPRPDDGKHSEFQQAVSGQIHTDNSRAVPVKCETALV